MENGQYKEITDIGLAKNINCFYFKTMNWLEKEFKKGKGLETPLALIISGDSKVVAPLEDMNKEQFVHYLKIACRFMDAEAIMIFMEASRWTGDIDGYRQHRATKGEIHGDAKAVDIVSVIIETQGKQIMGWADVEVKGNKRTMKAMKWNVQDIPAEEQALFSNFLNKEKEAA
ncbi:MULTISPECIES: hypothetical protein [Burkholderiaceae]|uniref:hypothetical protein n=1 Tax=Burkholderiaceae TaxID=119060 RepID=UPI0011784A63|nr:MULTISPECIES: hypothetical protein [Burkholderiaceae]MBY4717494.1 hypothetical protein [Ralstonia mannitolilytica]MCW5156439.1 hypothetical protein [Burkholderia cenocepacia]